MKGAKPRGLTVSQIRDLRLVANGFVSSSIQGRIGSLVKRGLVEDLGLYDYENHTKRYGSDRYRATAAGWLELKQGVVRV